MFLLPVSLCFLLVFSEEELSRLGHSRVECFDASMATAPPS